MRPALARAQANGRAGALATVIAATGGGPRGLGAQMVVDADGGASGYLAGGCIEADVAGHALDCLRDGAPLRLTYGVGGPVDLPLPCGGRIEVLIEPLAPDDPAALALAASRRSRRPWAWTSDGRTRACAPFDAAAPEALAEASLVLRDDPFRIWRAHDPGLRLVLVGGEPTVLRLAELAAGAEMQVTVVRPRGPAEPPPVAGVAYLSQALEPALDTLELDPWTALVAATHDAEVDALAAGRALAGGCVFVAAIGSHRRAGEVRARMAAAGIAAADAARLSMPAGLPIGGSGPSEVAISVLAELMASDNRTRAARRRQAARGDG